MHLLGNDFTGVSNGYLFENWDLIKKHFDSNPDLNIELIYSTPENYYEDLKKNDNSYNSINTDLASFKGIPHDYWVGFYSTRPSFKKFVKETSR